MPSANDLRLLLFNLATDADDPVLGFTTAWINALAPHCQFIDVVAMRAGRLALAPNVRVFSVGKEKGYSQPRRAIEFYRLLLGLLQERRYDAFFAHMMPLFAVMGAPVLKLRSVPITLWYTHKSVTRMLQIAEKLADRVVTASPESFRIPSHKAQVIGHGIDTDVFSPLASPHPAGRAFTLASIGRVAPIKHLEVLIDALALLVRDYSISNIHLQIVGETYAGDRAYEHELRRQVERLGLGKVVEFVGPISFAQIPGVFQSADATVNLSATGSLDKAILESMSCAVPVITSNEAAWHVLAQWADQLIINSAPDHLAQRIFMLIQLPTIERRKLGLELREVVLQNHSLARLAQNLVSLLEPPIRP